MSNSTKTAFTMTCSILLGACAHFDRPGVNTGFAAESVATLSRSAPAHWLEGNPNKSDPIKQAWLEDFGDKALNQHAQQALSGNFDLQTVANRLKQASIELLKERANKRPNANLGFDAKRTKTQTDPSTLSNDFGLDANISWELDLWGRLAKAKQAADYDLLAARADFQAAQLSLVANVTQQWFATIEARQQTELSRLIVDTLEQTVETIEAQYQSGLSSALDVRLARGNLASAQNTLIGHQRTALANARQFNVLLGDYPDTALDTPNELPTIHHTVPAGLPSALLLRRPDILAAERRLRSAGLTAKQANSNRLPSFKLTSNAGLSSNLLRDLLDWDLLVWNIVSSITAPLFDAGKLKAERLLAQTGQQAAWIDYAKTVQNAFLEVENALSADRFFKDQIQALSLAKEESELAATLASSRYQNGLENITTLLDAHRRHVETERNLLTLQRQQLITRVQLYLALGGAFSVPPS